MDDRWRTPRTVVVTFATEYAVDRAIQTFEVGALRRWVANATGYASEDVPVAFEGTVLAVSRPVEPAELYWHNSHYRAANRYARLLVAFAATAVALFFFCFLAFRLRVFPYSLSVFVTAVNAALPTFLKGLSDAVERHRDFGDAQDAMFVKLILARWTNTAILVFVAYGPRDRLSAAALRQVMLILLSDAFVAPLLRVFDPYDLFMRYVVSVRQPTQRAMNRFWVGADWNIAERYTDGLKTLFVGLFYAAAVPNGLFVTAAALCTSFAADRFCLLRRWARKPDFDDQIAGRAIGVVSVVVFAFSLSSLETFSNWGLLERDAVDAYDESTMGVHSNCFSFGGCDHDGDKAPTAAQRFAVRALRPLGLVALALAAWKLVGVTLVGALDYCLRGGSDHGKDTMPISYRDLKLADVYAPVVPHPLPGEPPLLAATITGVPRDRLPLPPNVDPAKHTVCSREVLRPLLPDNADDAHVDQVIKDLYGAVSYYAPPAGAADEPRPPPPPPAERHRPGVEMAPPAGAARAY